MFYPCILPDEFYLGYFGRLNSFNGFNDHGKRLLSMLREILPSTVAPVDYTNLEGVLAYSANMALREFVRNHTLVPYRQMFTRHGSNTSIALSGHVGRGPIRSQAYLCARCIDKDIHDIGFSYWRRTHQLPGMHVCVDHDEILRHIEKKDAFMGPPSDYVDTASTANESWAIECHEHPAVRVFLELSIHLASSEKSLRLGNVKPLLALQAAHKRLVPSPHYIGNHISNHVIATFPTKWLNDICQTIATKPSRRRGGHAGEMQFLSSDPYVTTQYLMEVAVLFDSAEEALAAMLEADDPSSSLKASLGHPEVDFRAEYIRTRGKYRRIAHETGRKIYGISQALRLIGLPNLTDKGNDNEKLLQAARSFFVEGYTCAVSAERAGAKLEDFERILRYAGIALHKALQEMEEEIASATDNSSLGMPS